jgi:DNA-binding transcriptional regulator YiaG
VYRVTSTSTHPESLLKRLRAAQLPPPRERRRIFREARATNAAAAEVLGVSEMTVSRWQRGETEPRTVEQATHYRQLLDALRRTFE